jgi:serine/threonine protein kinase
MAVKKDDMLNILVTHFKNKDGNYFISKVNQDENIHNKYIHKWLNVLTLKEIKKVYNDIVLEDIPKLPIKNKVVLLPIEKVKTEKNVRLPIVKIKKETNIKLPIVKIEKEKVKCDIEYLPFETIRKVKNLEETIGDIVQKYSRNKKSLLRSIMILSQLFKDDIVKMKDNKYKDIEVKIIDYLSLRNDTLLYIGIVQSMGKLSGKKVVVKVQSRIPELYKRDDVDKKKKISLDYSFQITTENDTMRIFEKNCLNALVPRSYSYGLIKPLIDGDMERYILISELLGNDLSKVLKKQPVENIKVAMIKSIYALKTMHSCCVKDNKISFIHKDIKHENIVFTDNKNTDVKIIDFGLTENIFNRNGNRDLKPVPKGEGTPLYMSTMQHIVSIKDYMDDFQAFAWMILDLLGDKPIIDGMPWKMVSCGKNANKDIYDKKIEFMEKCNDSNYTVNIENGTLSSHNISIIGELANYTLERADKVDKYNTDLKITNGNWTAYYSNYNEKYYEDIENIIKKLK